MRPVLMNLWEQGVEVFQTTSIEEAMALVVENSPEFVLIGVDHPKYNEVISFKHAVETNMRSNVIGFVEKDSGAMLNRLASSKCEYSITPPLDSMVVVRTLKKILKDHPERFHRQPTLDAPVVVPEKTTKATSEKLNQDEVSDLSTAIADALQQAIDQCCHVERSETRVYSLKNVAKLKVRPARIAEQKGYLIFASAESEIHEDQDPLWLDLCDYVSYWLSTKGIQIEFEPSIEVVVEEVNFLPWALADSWAVKAGFSRDREIGVAFLPRAKDQIASKPAKVPDYLEVPVECLPAAQSLPFNVFLHLEANSKVALIVKSGGYLRGPQREKILASKNPIVLIRASDFSLLHGVVIGADLQSRIEKFAFAEMNRELKRSLAEKSDQARIKGEILSAQGVQDFLFPPNHFVNESAEIRGFHERASECGGDWWYYQVRGDDMFIWIGDATGHGLSAALVTSAARAASAILGQFPELPLPQVMGMLNAAVFGAGGGQVLMTFFLGKLNLSSGLLSFCNASHNPPYWFPHSVEQLKKSDIKMIEGPIGPRLGENPTTVFKEEAILLKPGDRVMLFTDGLPELENPEGKVWGERAFIQSIITSFNQNSGITLPMQKLVRSIDEFRRSHPYVDDVTFVMLQYKPKARIVRFQ